MNDAGVFSASIRTRESAGWMRCCSASKSEPVVGGDDDLAVDHAALGQLGLAAATSSGKYRVIGFSLRLPNST